MQTLLNCVHITSVNDLVTQQCEKMVLKNYNDLKAKQVNDCSITINNIKCHISKRYMAWDNKKQCYPFLAGQSTKKRKA